MRILFCLMALVMSGCAARASGTAIAEEISSPKPGYSCFQFMDEAGKVINGTCVKD
jgi:hypothetical protein